MSRNCQNNMWQSWTQNFKRKSGMWLFAHKFVLLMQQTSFQARINTEQKKIQSFIFHYDILSTSDYYWSVKLATHDAVILYCKKNAFIIQTTNSCIFYSHRRYFSSKPSFLGITNECGHRTVPKLMSVSQQMISVLYSQTTTKIL